MPEFSTRTPPGHSLKPPRPPFRLKLNEPPAQQDWGAYETNSAAQRLWLPQQLQPQDEPLFHGVWVSPQPQLLQPLQLPGQFPAQ